MKAHLLIKGMPKNFLIYFKTITPAIVSNLQRDMSISGPLVKSDSFR